MFVCLFNCRISPLFFRVAVAAAVEFAVTNLNCFNFYSSAYLIHLSPDYPVTAAAELCRCLPAATKLYARRVMPLHY